jgi:hypothetical protein
VDRGALVGALLLETAPDGAFGKLELATAAGLITLHPEASTLHGNVVRPDGIEHVTLPWSPDELILVDGTPATAAAAARLLAQGIRVGEERALTGVAVGVALVVRRATFRVQRLGTERWRFARDDGGAETVVDLDEDGIPVLADGRTWPLESVAAVDEMWTSPAIPTPAPETRG